MLLDVILPTFSRPVLVRRALQSVCAARIPPGLAVQLVVVDNDPRRSGLRAVEDLAARAALPVLLISETRPGKSHALNTAIRATAGEYVAFIDDDEEVHPQWLEVIAAAIAGRRPDFLGGPTIPRWPARVPRWLPRDYPAVLGIVDNGAATLQYGDGCPGMLTGGNSVIARAMFDRVGLFSPLLGPRRDCRLFSCEDEDMYWRLLDAGAAGWYLPEMIVYHHIHPERLSKRYYRNWCFWNGASKAVLGLSRPATVPVVAGIPRHLYGRAVRGAVAAVKRTVMRGAPARRFAAELTMWDLAGHLYGRHFYKVDPSLDLQRDADRVRPPAKDVGVVIAG